MDDSSRAQVFIDRSLSVLIVSRDHEEFLPDLFRSIEREFPKDIDIVMVDVGSLDNTVASARHLSHVLDLRLRIVEVGRDSVSLDAFEAARPLIDTEYVAAISGDDVFGEEFFLGFLSERDVRSNPFVLNFELILVDSKLQPFGHQTPRWGGSTSKNRKRLMRGNPGTAPGSILPWQLLVNLPQWKYRPKILIEDYWLWWTLLEHADFSCPSSGTVLYRRHSANLSGKVGDSRYVGDLGYCVRLSWTAAVNHSERFWSLMLLLRWARRVRIRQIPNYLRGFRLRQVVPLTNKAE
jgi:glycosyltransferase involved in cell wall biosynthesis